MFELFWQAILILLLLSLVASPLGCLIIWQELNFYSDSLAHASALGLVLAFLLGFNPVLGLLAVALLMATIISKSPQHYHSNNLTIILSAQIMLAAALVLYAITGIRLPLEAYLFGDILLTSSLDVAIIAGASISIGCWLYYNWRNLCLLTLSQELAMIHGVNAQKLKRELLLLISILISIAIQITGLLLLSSILILPAAIAGQISRNPTAMAVLATIIAVIGAALGFLASFYYDIPSGAMIVVGYGCMYMVAKLVPKHS